jgi:hypothetical protein
MAMLRKVDKLSCIRFGSARYSVPMRLIGKQVEVVVAAGQLRERPASKGAPEASDVFEDVAEIPV